MKLLPDNRKQLWSIIAVFLLTAATPPLWHRAKFYGGYHAITDLSYGDLNREKLDVYLPEHSNPSHSVILFIYGGGWQGGNKHHYRFIGQKLAASGFVTVVADYRLYPQVYYPAFVEDAAGALKWTHDHIQDYGGDTSRLYVMGHSAGAHTALMLTMNDQFIRKNGGDTSWIKGTVGLAGIYDHLPYTVMNMQDIFSKTPENETMPIDYARPGLTPVLLLHGNEDHVVSINHSINLAERLKRDGNDVTFKTYDHVDHMSLVESLSPKAKDHPEILENITGFIDQQNKR